MIHRASPSVHSTLSLWLGLYTTDASGASKRPRRFAFLSISGLAACFAPFERRLNCSAIWLTWVVRDVLTHCVRASDRGTVDIRVPAEPSAESDAAPRHSAEDDSDVSR